MFRYIFKSAKMNLGFDKVKMLLKVFLENLDDVEDAAEGLS